MAFPTFPLTMPTSPTNFVTSEWMLMRTAGYTESPFTYVQQVAEYQGTKWSTIVTLPPMSKADAGAWTAFFTQLHGRRGTFLIGDPDKKTISGTASGTMSVNGDHAIGAYSVIVDGLNASQSTAFKKGDYVQFGSGATSKLHMIVEDISTDSSGNATLQIEPSLKTALSDDDVVTYSDTKMVARMDSDELGWQTNVNSLYQLSFSCSEVL
jgi:hypothetical protein|tara:strand:+ start:17 stop:646 length:630 start_codon:yes stop_codon:yes gene_type:complete